MYPETRDAFQNKVNLITTCNHILDHINTVNPQPSVLERFTGQRNGIKERAKGKTMHQIVISTFRSDEQRKTRYQPSMYHTEPIQPEQAGPNTQDIRIRAPNVVIVQRIIKR